MRPIDADALRVCIMGEPPDAHYPSYYADVVDKAPTLDVQPVDVVFTLRRALVHMWYAYANKDSEYPHEFELEAVREAERLLGKWEDCMPIMIRRADDAQD